MYLYEDKISYTVYLYGKSYYIYLNENSYQINKATGKQTLYFMRIASISTCKLPVAEMRRNTLTCLKTITSWTPQTLYLFNTLFLERCCQMFVSVIQSSHSTNTYRLVTLTG